MNVYTCIIVEDEVNSYELLKKIIAEYCPSLQLIGHARGVEDAFKLLESQPCDILFLDIEIEGGKSFEVLNQLTNRDFSIIFTTAYDTYAIEAFKVDAVDYILKPYAPTDIIAAVQRVIERKSSGAAFQHLHSLLNNQNGHKKIALSTMEGVRFCSADEIIRLEAEGSYCTVYLEAGDRVVVSKTLLEVEKSLPKNQFFRAHAKHAINKDYVKQILHADGGHIEMTNGDAIPIARRRKKELLNFL